jgi:hypothetical protein
VLQRVLARVVDDDDLVALVDELRLGLIVLDGVFDEDGLPLGTAR